MKLLRLKLANWRGVEACEVDFADTVTLIEGPNEIGKSTIVEAIQTIFKVMDSSSKGDIKAIQPVGKDVGSFVEVEVEVAGCRFIYSKTYNKNRQTELRILTPSAEQLTGREAHERVVSILEASVDMALWDALLMEQGGEIAAVTLSQSDGLARALDEAAGGEALKEDDSDLFVRVRAEYEQYFTLKTGKPRYAALENTLETLRADVDRARSEMAEIENDSDLHERCVAEIRRLEGQIPELLADEQSHEARWRAIGEIKGRAASKAGELEAAEQLLQASGDDLERRQRLKNSIEDGMLKIAEALDQVSGQAQQVGHCKKAMDDAAGVVTETKKKLKGSAAIADLARSDLRHLGNVAELASARRKLDQLRNYQAGLDLARKSLRGIKVNAAGLEQLRSADSQLQVALARLNTVTSSVEITAERNLKLSLNDAPLELGVGESERRDITAEMELAIPGIASVRIVPSQSVNELESEVAECRESLQRLLQSMAVRDLADAVAAETMRVSNQQQVESWSQKIDALLGDASAADCESEAADLQVKCSDYSAQRVAKPAMPADLAEASKVAANAESILSECETALEEQQATLETLREDFNQANVQHRMAETELGGQKKVLEQQQQELENSRSAEDDAAIAQRVEEKSSAVKALQKELARLNAQLESASPEAIEALFDNARAARQRAANDFATQQTQLAVLEDRLIKAQADGRFETLEIAQHKLTLTELDYQATLARAAAARRLWEVLSRHRDAARRAYVRPLKEGVEQLGKIVFGPDFSIEIDSDWSLLSRTQGGKTIPFGALSVGAKEQLGILMRLAAARIVSRQGGVPLIIDDALGFSDPVRLKTMGAAIASAGNDCQVVLLTCTPGRFTHVGNAEVVRF